MSLKRAGNPITAYNTDGASTFDDGLGRKSSNPVTIYDTYGVPVDFSNLNGGGEVIIANEVNTMQAFSLILNDTEEIGQITRKVKFGGVIGAPDNPWFTPDTTNYSMIANRSIYACFVSCTLKRLSTNASITVYVLVNGIIRKEMTILENQQVTAVGVLNELNQGDEITFEVYSGGNNTTLLIENGQSHCDIIAFDSELIQDLDIQIDASNINYVSLNSGDYSVSDALDLIIANGVTQDQLKFSNLLDVNTGGKAELLYQDDDGIVKGIELRDIGVSARDETLIYTSSSNQYPIDSGLIKVPFDANVTYGDKFSYSGNGGIVIEDVNTPFTISGTISLSMLGYWVGENVNAKARLYKNGIDTGLFVENNIPTNGTCVLKASGFNSEDIVGLAIGDYLEIFLDVSSSSGFQSWAKVTIVGGSNFACLYRNIVTSGRGIKIEDTHSLYMEVSKTATQVCPSGNPSTDEMGLITWDNAEFLSNTEKFSYKPLLNAWEFVADQKYTFDLKAILPMTKSGSEIQNGSIEFMLLIEYRATESDPWEQYSGVNIGEVQSLAGSVKAFKFDGTFTLNKVGIYRFRTLWLNTGVGTMTHTPSIATRKFNNVTYNNNKLGRFRLIGTSLH